jgi:hypothetical protein
MWPRFWMGIQREHKRWFAELAEHYDAFLQQIAPDFPLARRLHKQLFPGLLRRLWRGVTGMIIRS